MKKAVLAAVTAALIAGTAATYAANPGDAREGGRRWQPTAEDAAILTDARIAALKTGLKLTPDQEKLWPAVETALRDVAKGRAERAAAARTAREQARQQDQANRERPDPITRMRTAADRMTAAATDLRKIADASDPLYKTLDDSQKARLDVLIRQNFRGPHWGGPGRGGPGGPRHGMMMPGEMGPGGPGGPRHGMMEPGDMGPHGPGGPRFGMLPPPPPPPGAGDPRFAMGPMDDPFGGPFGPVGYEGNPFAEFNLGPDGPSEPGPVPVDFL